MDVIKIGKHIVLVYLNKLSGFSWQYLLNLSEALFSEVIVKIGK